MHFSRLRLREESLTWSRLTCLALVFVTWHPLIPLQMDQGHEVIYRRGLTDSLILEDSLTVPGIIWPFTCPTGRNFEQFTPDGLKLVVTGRCVQSDQVDRIGPAVQGLSFVDGEIRMEVLSIADRERLVFSLRLRVQEGATAGYVVIAEPSRGRLDLRRIDQGIGTSLAERTDLGDFLQEGNWTSLGIRAKGPDLTVLLDDVPVLTATDGTYQQGVVSFAVLRRSSSDAGGETSVVVRNLRVTDSPSPQPALRTMFARPPSFEAIPQPSSLIVQDPLTHDGIVSLPTCPQAPDGARFSPIGLRMQLHRRCDEGAGVVLRAGVRQLEFGDGEIRVEGRASEWSERLSLVVYFRTHGGATGYFADVQPIHGIVRLGKWADGRHLTFAQRANLLDLVGPYDWIRIAVRVRGPSIWLLVNDEVVLSASDNSFESGNVLIGITRRGNLEDDHRVSGEFRNLSVSSLVH